MIINKMAKFFIKLILLSQFLLFTNQLKAADQSFNNWLDNFKNVAQSEGVSKVQLMRYLLMSDFYLR